MSKFTESTVEEAVPEWAEGLAYAVLYGPEIAPDEPAAERESFGEVLLIGSLRDAITRFVDRFHANRFESRDVTRTLDKLLPKLLSRDFQALQAGALT